MLSSRFTHSIVLRYLPLPFKPALHSLRLLTLSSLLCRLCSCYSSLHTTTTNNNNFDSSYHSVLRLVSASLCVAVVLTGLHCKNKLYYTLKTEEMYLSSQCL